jgi:hydrophobic/amphiphilic exporter-1 (mainly G- bacteria), HAE1 family
MAGGGFAGTAAEKGARDVTLPILASTATTLIVLVPFVYLRGELRIMYLPLAVVVGLTLIASIFVAFTFIPALAARLLGEGKGGRRAHRGLVGPRPPPETPSAGAAGADDARCRSLPAFRHRRPPLYIRFYQGLLEGTLRLPWLTVAVAVVCFAASWWVFDNHVTRGQIWGGGFGAQRSYVQINIAMPRGSDLERVDDLARYFEERLDRMPELEKYTTSVRNAASIRVDFPLELEFTAVPLVIEEQLRAHAVTFTGANVTVFGQGPSFGSGGGGTAPNYTITFLGYNYERLAEIAEDFGRRIGQNARVHEVDTNASAGFFVRDRATEFVAVIDRDAAARHGITVQEATGLIRSSLRGTGPQGSVVLGEEPVRFEVKLAGYRQADVLALQETVVATSGATTCGSATWCRSRSAAC